MNNISVAPKVATRQKTLLDLRLNGGRLISPTAIDAFQSSDGGGTTLYMSSGVTVSTSFYNAGQIAKTLKPYLKEPLITVRRLMPYGILPPQEYYLCGEAIMGIVVTSQQGIDGGKVFPVVRVHLRGALPFDIANVSKQELDAAFKEACGAELLVVQPEAEKRDHAPSGPDAVGVGLHEYLDTYAALAGRSGSQPSAVQFSPTFISVGKPRG